MLARICLLLTLAHAQSALNPAKAYGLNAQRGVLTASGTALVHGAEQKFRFTFDRFFHYRLQVDGPIPQIDGYDGKTTWTEGPSGVPHQTYSLESDAGRAVAWAMSGLWADPHAPLKTTPWPDSTDLALLPREGVAAVRISVDPQTGYLIQLTYNSPSGPQEWHFQDFKSFGGRTIPTHFVLHSGPQDDVYDIDTLTTDKAPGSFRMPLPAPGRSLYDPSQSPSVPVKRVGGYLFIRPKLNGQDVGWFFLDSGADVCCIDPEIAKQLGLPKVGSDTTAGAVAVSQMSLYRADTLQAGPETIHSLVMLELDLKGISKAIGFPVVGVCGYDLLARCVVDIDPAQETIALDEATTDPSGQNIQWQPIRFSGNTPVVDAAFAPDHKGGFQLDTGSGSTVDFFSPTVLQFHLDHTLGATKARTVGAGGGADSLQGRIDWFDLGGTRIDKPRVGFQLATTGAFANPFLCGNIGMGFMGKFHVVFDYPHQRVGFAKE